jgi:hypothetical protein
MTEAVEDKADMPVQTSQTVDLSKDQLKALFGEGHDCVPGESYTVTLKAGEKTDGGFQKFTVSSDGDADNMGDVESETEDEGEVEEEESSSPDEISALGYDRNKMLAGKRKQSPKISAKDLSYD